MTKVIYTVGISASGKSTWAKGFIQANPDYTQVERDQIRWELFTEGVPDWTKYKFTKQREKAVTEEHRRRILEARERGQSVVISDTHTNLRTKAKMLQWLAENNFEDVEEKVFEVDVIEALQRDARRVNGVGYKVIMRQYKDFCEQRYGGDYHKHSPDKRDAVIFDVDGTLADMIGVRKPYDWHLVGDDLPRHHVIEMAQMADDESYQVIFMSGRDGICLEDTRKWLNQHTGLTNAWLFMREAGDSRKDTIVKKELFDKYVDHNFNVFYCVDDRPSVCRMWQYEKGIPVVNVGDPWQEF